MTLAMPMRPEISVHPAANHDTSWRDNSTGRTDDRRSHHGSTAAGGDAASTNDPTRANNGARFHRAQGGEACCPQYGNHQMFHDGSPWLFICGSVSSASCGDVVRVD
jgi:hypothetical protein